VESLSTKTIPYTLLTQDILSKKMSNCASALIKPSLLSVFSLQLYRFATFFSHFSSRLTLTVFLFFLMDLVLFNFFFLTALLYFLVLTVFLVSLLDLILFFAFIFFFPPAFDDGFSFFLCCGAMSAAASSYGNNPCFSN